jgi:phage repressor protein C with HTH and peptisase S24 domain
MPRRAVNGVHSPNDTALLDSNTTALPDRAECIDDSAMMKQTSIRRAEWLIANFSRKEIMRVTGVTTSSAVTEWKRTGRIAKAHLPKLAALTGTVSDWWLENDVPVPPTARWLTGSTELVPSAPTNVHQFNRRVDDREDSVSVPMLGTRASAGPGQAQPEHDPLVGTLKLSVAWIRTRLPALSATSNLVTLIAYGRSMEPTFCDGSILLVDRGAREVSVDGVYVLAMNEQLYVKRVTRRLPDGALLVRSDNPLHEGFTIPNGERDVVQVLGRLVWVFDSKGI